MTIVVFAVVLDELSRMFCTDKCHNRASNPWRQCTKSSEGTSILIVDLKVIAVLDCILICNIQLTPKACPAILVNIQEVHQDCWTGLGGQLDIADQDTIQYSYDFQINNKNARTLAGFSTSAKDLMHDCDTCPYKTYEKFIQYYGEYDYGHQIITTALYQGQTSFKNGNHDFSKNYQLGIPGMCQSSMSCGNI
jgi:hypothetical protein